MPQNTTTSVTCHRGRLHRRLRAVRGIGDADRACRRTRRDHSSGQWKPWCNTLPGIRLQRRTRRRGSGVREVGERPRRPARLCYNGRTVAFLGSGDPQAAAINSAYTRGASGLISNCDFTEFGVGFIRHEDREVDVVTIVFGAPPKKVDPPPVPQTTTCEGSAPVPVGNTLPRRSQTRRSPRGKETSRTADRRVQSRSLVVWQRRSRTTVESRPIARIARAFWSATSHCPPTAARR